MDDASCIAVHDKFIAIGGASGRVYLFDHLGNSHLECVGTVFRFIKMLLDFRRLDTINAR